MIGRLLLQRLDQYVQFCLRRPILVVALNSLALFVLVRVSQRYRCSISNRNVMDALNRLVEKTVHAIMLDPEPKA